MTVASLLLNEGTGKKHEVAGLLRPAFEVYLKESSQEKRLEPSDVPDTSPTCPLTVHRLDLRPSQRCALH